MAQLFDNDPVTRTTRLFHWDESDESFHIETLQDATDVIEANKAAYNQFDERTPWKGEWHRVGCIPLSEYFALPKELREDNKDLLRWLASSDRSDFKTRPWKGLI